MISEKDRVTIVSIATQYNVKRVFLFGSNALPLSKEGNDIDLAVQGIRDEDFFKFYGELLFSLKKPVDLIDLSLKNKFNHLVR